MHHKFTRLYNRIRTQNSPITHLYDSQTPLVRAGMLFRKNRARMRIWNNPAVSCEVLLILCILHTYGIYFGLTKLLSQDWWLPVTANYINTVITGHWTRDRQNRPNFRRKRPIRVRRSFQATGRLTSS